MAASDDTPALAKELLSVLEDVMNAEASLLASNFEWSDKKVRQQNFERGIRGIKDARTKLRVLVDAAANAPSAKGSA